MNKTLMYGLSVLVAGTLMTGKAQAGHWTGPAEVMRYAHQLENATRRFHGLLHNITGASHIAEDAHKFAAKAGHLHRTVESGATYDHVVDDYLEMKSAFFHLRQMVRQDHSLHHYPSVRRNFMRVEMAMHNLEYAMEQGDDDDHDGDDDDHGFPGHGGGFRIRF